MISPKKTRVLVFRVLVFRVLAFRVLGLKSKVLGLSFPDTYPIILPSAWLRKRFREIERAEDSADINGLRACAGDCPSADDSGAGDKGTGACGIGDRGTGSGNRGAGDSVSGRGSLDLFSG